MKRSASTSRGFWRRYAIYTIRCGRGPRRSIFCPVWSSCRTSSEPVIFFSRRDGWMQPWQGISRRVRQKLCRDFCPIIRITRRACGEKFCNRQTGSFALRKLFMAGSRRGSGEKYLGLCSVSRAGRHLAGVGLVRIQRTAFFSTDFVLLRASNAQAWLAQSILGFPRLWCPCSCVGTPF